MYNMHFQITNQGYLQTRQMQATYVLILKALRSNQATHFSVDVCKLQDAEKKSYKKLKMIMHNVRPNTMLGKR